MAKAARVEKDDFLGGKTFTLLIDWPEPFGPVMIEAIACGIPVSGFRCGSVPQVVEDGVSGFIVDSVDEAARAVERVSKLSRASHREAFLRRFRASRMAEDYVAVCERLRPEGAAPEEATAA